MSASDYRQGIWSDIHSGTGCKDVEHGIIFNTDGISLYKSSRITVWPILIAFADLPPRVRMNKDNFVTVALWAGETKPPMKVLFEPLISFFTDLSCKGLKINFGEDQRVFIFKPLFGSFDLIAKAPILNMHQFNGKNGCPYCTHPGEWTHGSRYYLPHVNYTSRNDDSVKLAATKAEEKNSIIDGIKGKSILRLRVPHAHELFMRLFTTKYLQFIHPQGAATNVKTTNKLNSIG